MSAYIVENETINKILSMLYLDRDNSWVQRRILEKHNIDIKTKEGLETLGKHFLRINIYGVENRYDEKVKGTLLLDFKYRLTPHINKISALKALECLIYQCSEPGEWETVDSEIYKLMEEIKGKWAMDIVRALPAYDNAQWG